LIERGTGKGLCNMPARCSGASLEALAILLKILGL
jgi:hypothetical protein